MQAVQQEAHRAVVRAANRVQRLEAALAETREQTQVGVCVQEGRLTARRHTPSLPHLPALHHHPPTAPPPHTRSQSLELAMRDATSTLVEQTQSTLDAYNQELNEAQTQAADAGTGVSVGAWGACVRGWV